MSPWLLYIHDNIHMVIYPWWCSHGYTSMMMFSWLYLHGNVSMVIYPRQCSHSNTYLHSTVMFSWWYLQWWGGGPRVVVSTAAFHARVRGLVSGLGGLKETKMFLPHPRVKVSIVGSLRDREVACSASDRQGANFESCVWRTVSSQSSHHPHDVLLAQFSLYMHKGGLKPESFLSPMVMPSWWCFPDYTFRDMFPWLCLHGDVTRAILLWSCSYGYASIVIFPCMIIYHYGYTSGSHPSHSAHGQVTLLIYEWV